MRTVAYLAIVDTAVFQESDDVFREHVLWDLAGPLMVGVGVAIVSLAVRRLLDRLTRRRKEKEKLLREALLTRRAVAYLLELRVDDDRQAAELLDDLQRGEEKWR